jgi:hypothetical protein
MREMKGTKSEIWGACLAGGIALALASPIARAAPSAKRSTAKKPSAAATTAAKKPDPYKGYRKKELNFEDRVIEGLSNRGYESLSQTGTNDGLKGEKLYRKRAEFDEDSKAMLREMEYLK